MSTPTFWFTFGCITAVTLIFLGWSIYAFIKKERVVALITLIGFLVTAYMLYLLRGLAMIL